MFTIPLYDDNPTSRPAVMTWALIAACVLAFLWQVSLGPAGGERAVYGLGVIPVVLFGRAELPPELALVPSWATILTSMFLHGGWLHLLGNMLYLWIFGNNVEDAMGPGRFLAFYLLCGTAAALAQSLAGPLSTVPMIGASGAIGGVLGAYLMLHPRANVYLLVVIVFFVRFISVPAALVLGLWFVMQFLSGASTPVGGGGVAFWAHVGGFVAGMVLVPVFKRRAVPLFDRHHSRTFAVLRPSEARPRRNAPSAGARQQRR
jgi:membrane associated rhomboid family serine protease